MRFRPKLRKLRPSWPVSGEILQIVGLLVVAYGLFTLARWLGIAALGAAVFFVGFVFELRGRRHAR